MTFTMAPARAQRPVLALVAVLLAGSASRPPAVVAQSTPFPLSSCSDCAQGSGAVAGNPQGAFLAAWTGESGEFPAAVPARFFLPTGAPRAADFLLSTAPAQANGDVAVAAEDSGFFSAAWSRQIGANSEIFVQRFRRTTAPLGAAIQVSLDEPGTVKLDGAPALAYLPDQSFVVVWARYGPAYGGSGGSQPEVMARRYNARGRALSPPTRISDGLVDFGHVAVCADRQGALVAGWTSVDGFFPFQANKKGVTLRRLTPNVQPLGAEIVAAAATAAKANLALACGTSGFTAVWQTDQAPASGAGIVARRYGASGLPSGNPFVVSAPGPSGVSAPAASADAAGNVVVSWVERGASVAQVFFRGIAATDANGTSLEPQTFVDTLAQSSGGLVAPAISHLGRGGDFVVVWLAGADGLLGRRYSAAGLPLARSAVPMRSDAATDSE